MPPTTLTPLSGRYLSFAEREEIALLRAQKYGVRAIARQLARASSTVSRELRRNAATRSGGFEYRASTAQWHADRKSKRPKVAKLAANGALRQYVEARLAGTIAAGGDERRGPDVRWNGRRHGRRQDRRWATSWSPEQIAARLKLDFPDDHAMRVSHEAIYQALYVQGRGALRRELVTCLRTGRALRVPRARTGRGKAFVSAEVMIAERPPEANDRAVPGHWEGDLIIGKNGKSGIATLVERSTRYVLLAKISDLRAETVRDALVGRVATLPDHLWRSLTWDQGSEMAQHQRFTTDTGIDVYFCDPHSPWQRGSNENTNGLLRQYFPKGTPLGGHSQEHLDAVAVQLNSRPRETLGWETPAERLAQLVASTD